MKTDKSLSRRERQIMDIVYELKEVSALQVLERLPSPPGYSAVRALLRVLSRRAISPTARTGRAMCTLPACPRTRPARPPSAT